MRTEADTPDSFSVSTRTRNERFLASGLSLVIFLGVLWVYTRSNTFPARYHPDEEGKANQVLSDWRNFRHPQLLLEASTLLVRARNIDETQQVVVAGRWISALCSAGAVVSLALAAYLEAGIGAMLVAAVFVGLCPFLLVHAHYMKEDTALVLGVAMVVLAARMLWHPWRSWSAELLTVAFLGLSCAIATSGKYIGAFTVLIALLILFIGRRWRVTDLILRTLTLIVTFTACTAAINYRAFQDCDQFISGFESESVHLLSGHLGFDMPVPHTHFLEVIARSTPTSILLLAVAGLIMLGITWRKRNTWDFFLPALILIQVLMLCFCHSFIARYALPAIVLMHLLAAMGLVWTWQWSRELYLPHLVLPGLTAIVAINLGWLCYDTLAEFRDDSRDRVRAWLIANTSTGDRVLTDTYAGFFPPLGGSQSDELKTGVAVSGEFYAAASVGSAQALKDKGYTYIVVTPLAYERFFNAHIVPTKSNQDFYDATRTAYQDIFDHATLVWSSKPRHGWMTYVDPEIRVYRP